MDLPTVVLGNLVEATFHNELLNREFWILMKRKLLNSARHLKSTKFYIKKKLVVYTQETLNS